MSLVIRLAHLKVLYHLVELPEDFRDVFCITRSLECTFDPLALHLGLDEFRDQFELPSILHEKPHRGLQSRTDFVKDRISVRIAVGMSSSDL